MKGFIDRLFGRNSKHVGRKNRAKPTRRSFRPMLEALEERRLMAAVIFDYSYDISGFFSDETGAPDTPRAALVRAANDLTGRLNDTLAAIPAPAEGDTWSAEFFNPSNGDELISLPNLEVPADTLIIFVGGRTFEDTRVGFASTQFAWSGSIAWGETVEGRGQPGAVGPEEARTDVSPWGGSIGFDYTFGNYYFGEDPAGLVPGQLDFYSLAQHELGHLLGFTEGTDSFKNRTEGDSFVGDSAMNAFGGPVPMDVSGGHWQDELLFEGGQTTMDPSLPSGVRVAFTALDWAALSDIGWDVEDVDQAAGAIQIDASALPGSWLSLDYESQDADGPINANLLPGSHFIQAYGGDILYFTVAGDGTVDYDPALDGIFSGRGTSALTVHGVAVDIDATALDEPYLGLDYTSYDSTQPLVAHLLPGQHFFDHNGNVYYFTVAADGLVDYDPSLDGILSGRGTPALTFLAQGGEEPPVEPAPDLNAAIVGIAESYLGQQVGDGECWTFVVQLFNEAGADTSGVVNDDYGDPIGLNEITAGDVLQFYDATVEWTDGNGGLHSATFSPRHTAIVYSVEGTRITLINSNINGDKTVQFTTIDLGGLQTGEIYAYRPLYA